MKKAIVFSLFVSLLCVLAGCGNDQYDPDHTYNQNLHGLDVSNWPHDPNQQKYYYKLSDDRKAIAVNFYGRGDGKGNYIAAVFEYYDPKNIKAPFPVGIWNSVKTASEWIEFDRNYVAWGMDWIAGGSADGSSVAYTQAAYRMSQDETGTFFYLSNFQHF